MLTKILFTLAVIAVVFLVYKARFRPALQQTRTAQAATDHKAKRASKWVVYSLASVVATAGAIVYFLKWQADNKVMTIRVVSSAQESPTRYKALQKDIKGRTFTTIDGLVVTLGDADRIELLEE